MYLTREQSTHARAKHAAASSHGTTPCGSNRRHSTIRSVTSRACYRWRRGPNGGRRVNKSRADQPVDADRTVRDPKVELATTRSEDRLLFGEVQQERPTPVNAG